jgi:hypothetical protein
MSKGFYFLTLVGIYNLTETYNMSSPLILINNLVCASQRVNIKFFFICQKNIKNIKNILNFLGLAIMLARPKRLGSGT